MKKKYNPLKMWGSWVGFVVGFTSNMYYKTYPSCNHGLYCVYSPTAYFIYSLGIGIIGFFIGWGINSLWRKYK